MSGFVPPVKVYRIVAEDGIYAGLTAKVRSVPLGEFMALAGLADGLDASTAASKFAEMGKLFAALADALVEWNLTTESDEPVPADLSGLYAQDLDLALFLIGEWIGAMGGVSGPLGTPPNPSAPVGVPDSSLALTSTPLPTSAEPS